MVQEAPNELALAHLSYLSPHSQPFPAIPSTAFLFYFFSSLIPASQVNCHPMALIILYLLFSLQCPLQIFTVSFILGLWLTSSPQNYIFLIPLSKLSPATHISYLVLSVSFPLTLLWVFFTAFFNSVNCHKKITIVIFTINKSQYWLHHTFSQNIDFHRAESVLVI